MRQESSNFMFMNNMNLWFGLASVKKKKVKPLGSQQYQDFYFFLSFLKLCPPIYNNLLLKNFAFINISKWILNLGRFCFQKIDNKYAVFIDVSKE